MNTSSRRKTRELLTQIKYLRKELGSMFPLQHVQILLEAALEEGLSHSEMYKRLEPQSSASTNRGIKALSKVSWRANEAGTARQRGKGLLTTEQDPMELRVKRILLSKQGHDFIKELSSLGA